MEITVEREHVSMAGQRKSSVIAWCAQCGAEVQMATPDDAAATAKVSMRHIYRWIESGQLHHAEAADGKVLVCFASLAGVPRSPEEGEQTIAVNPTVNKLKSFGSTED